MLFPSTLDAKIPIVLRTKHGTVRQYLASDETFHGGLHGRYLVYWGKERAILYRYDAAERQLREFVYLPSKSSLGKNGNVVRWQFEDAQLSLDDQGNGKLSIRQDLEADIKAVANHNMADRIQRFLAKRYGQSGAVKKTLFSIPRPDYVDANLVTRQKDIRYEVEDNQLRVVLNRDADLTFPLWVDPTLTADADANVILNGQSADDQLGFSVASAGDFNGDGLDDVIVGALRDDNSGSDSGSAFIFFGGVTGTKSADADADVILNGQSAGDLFGISVASAGDFNGDGLDDVIVGASGDDNSGESSGSAFIFFGEGTANTPPVADAGANQTVFSGDVVDLDGSLSDDVDGDAITYRWALTVTPAGSAATLDDTTAVMPSFVSDVAGEYVAQLIVNDGFADSAPVTVMIVVQPKTPSQATQGINKKLQDIVNANPGTPLADKVADASAKTQTALDELNKTPPDNQAALGNIEGAVGDLEAAIGLDPAQDPIHKDAMDQLARIARQVAVDVIDKAVAQGADPVVISDAQQALADGDAKRASGDFKDAVSQYKDALAKTESVLL